MKHTLIQRMKLVSDILAKHDPMKLISSGAPLDEYEYEAVELVRLLSLSKEMLEFDPTYLQRYTPVSTCRSLFRESFDGVMNEAYNWEPVVKEILEVLK